MLASKKPIKIIFIGTSDFGVPSLEALIKDNNFMIKAVITQPDKPAGRKQVLRASPIKQLAKKYKLNILQPKNINKIEEEIKSLNPGLIIVIAYAQILGENIINIPKLGSINVHASLLPKYRGAACIQAAILNGDKETGVSIIKMDKGLDTGPILDKVKVGIKKDDTAGSLHDKLAIAGKELLIPTIKKFLANKLKLEIQDESKASYVPRLKKLDGKIDWSLPANNIERLIRAMDPWPGTFSFIQDQRSKNKNQKIILKILSVNPGPIDKNNYDIGETFLYNKNLAIQCGQDALILEKLQLEGKKTMNTEEYLLGHSNIIGTVLK